MSPCVRRPVQGGHPALVFSHSPQAVRSTHLTGGHPCLRGEESCMTTVPVPAGAQRVFLELPGLKGSHSHRPSTYPSLFSPGPPTSLRSLWTVTLPSTSQRKTDLPTALPQPNLHPAKSLAPLQGSRDTGIFSKTTSFLRSPSPPSPGGPGRDLLSHTFRFSTSSPLLSFTGASFWNR